MTIIKNFMIKSLIIGLSVIYGGHNLFTFGSQYGEKTMRNVTLVDTSSTSYKHKKNVFYNTNGFFVDDVTGKHFRHSIRDTLYRDFASGGNAPIKLQLNVSNMDLDNNGVLNIWRGGGFIVMILGSFIVLYASLSSFFAVNRHYKYKNKLH